MGHGMRSATVVLILAALALAEPWAVHGFTATYSYRSELTGLLALRGKEINGTISFTYLNATNNYIYMNVTMNLTVTFLNKMKRHALISKVIKVPANVSSVFVTKESLKNLMKLPHKCEDNVCTFTLNANVTTKSGITVLTHGVQEVDTKEMLLTYLRTDVVYKSKTNKVIGTVKTEMKLIGVTAPRGTSR